MQIVSAPTTGVESVADTRAVLEGQDRTGESSSSVVAVEGRDRVGATRGVTGRAIEAIKTFK